MRRHLLILSLVAAWPLTLGAAAASAATEARAGVADGAIEYEAGDGDVTNNVTLSEPAPGRYVLRDTGGPIEAKDGCVQVAADRVRCATAGITRATLDLGDGNDTARVRTALPTTEEGGRGADRLTGGTGGDTLDGEEGNDRLTGGDGADALWGGDGSDSLDGGAGPDAFRGQEGTDVATYAARFEAVTVTIDDVADDGGEVDGPAGARDDVATDVENLVGGGGDDSMTGSSAGNTLTGGAGADSLQGAGGVDSATYADRTESQTVTIDGVADDGDASDGPPGARDNVATDIETLIGGSGADSLTGSAANNTLNGGGGADALSGLAGTDTVTYAGRLEPVTVTIDGVADDGGASDGPEGVRDNVGIDVENIVGGRGDDSLTGSAAPNRLTGGLGVDILRGLAGNDVLVANDGVADAELDCDGGANDVVHVDPLDPPSIGCEQVKD